MSYKLNVRKKSLTGKNCIHVTKGGYAYEL